MEKNYMSSDSLIELEFLMNTETKIHYHEDFELLYLLDGNLTVTVEDEIFAMKPRDIIVVNNNRKHSYIGSEDAFFARFSISYSITRRLLNQNVILFWCNSVVDKNQAYDDLRVVIMQIMGRYKVNDSNGSVYITSLYYQMLHILTSNFLLTSNNIRFEVEKGKTDDRLDEIFQYIRSNYRQNITLQDIADTLYISPAYLSKYIKKKCEISFLEIVNSVRLSHAIVDLLYTDASIMQIAMDNGFASVAAFNKVLDRNTI